MSAVVGYSIFIYGDDDDEGGSSEVWFPVWWMTEQLLSALTLVPDISEGRSLQS